MNRKTAEEKGYSYTGVYSFDKNDIDKRAAEEKTKGNKAVVVYVPASKYSNSKSGGYSMFLKKSEKRSWLRYKTSSGLRNPRKLSFRPPLKKKTAR